MRDGPMPLPLTMASETLMLLANSCLAMLLSLEFFRLAVEAAAMTPALFSLLGAGNTSIASSVTGEIVRYGLAELSWFLVVAVVFIVLNEAGDDRPVLHGVLATMSFGYAASSMVVGDWWIHRAWLEGLAGVNADRVLNAAARLNPDAFEVPYLAFMLAMGGLAMLSILAIRRCVSRIKAGSPAVLSSPWRKKTL